MRSSFSPSDSRVCLLRCPCLLVLCSDLLTQPLLTLFSLLTNPSPAELWAPWGLVLPPFGKQMSWGWPCRQMLHLAVGSELTGPGVRPGGGGAHVDLGGWPLSMSFSPAQKPGCHGAGWDQGRLGCECGGLGSRA